LIERRRGGVVMQKVSAINIPYVAKLQWEVVLSALTACAHRLEM